MNHRHQIFIAEMLRHGDREGAYLAAYPKSQPGHPALSAAHRLLQRPEIKEAIDEAYTRIRAMAEFELKEKIEQELLSLERTQQILTEIAEGRMKMEKNVKRRDGSYDVLMIPPSISQRLRAISIYLRMTGQYNAASKAKQEAKPKYDSFNITIDGKPFPKGPGYDPITQEKLPPSTPVIARSSEEPVSEPATKQSHVTMGAPAPHITDTAFREIASLPRNDDSVGNEQSPLANGTHKGVTQPAQGSIPTAGNKNSFTTTNNNISPRPPLGKTG